MHAPHIPKQAQRSASGIGPSGQGYELHQGPVFVSENRPVMYSQGDGERRRQLSFPLSEAQTEIASSSAPCTPHPLQRDGTLLLLLHSTRILNALKAFDTLILPLISHFSLPPHRITLTVLVSAFCSLLLWFRPFFLSSPESHPGAILDIIS